VERLFSEPEQNQLFEEFERAEEEIGANHEALVAMANQLATQRSC
jgi:hypothetical protein